MAETMNARGPSLTEQLALYWANARFEEMPAQAIQLAKRFLMDGLAAGVAGGRSEVADVAFRAARVQAEAASGASVLWGRRETLPAALAAMVNGTAMHALELDDFGGCGHSGAVVLSVLSALAARGGVSGKDAVMAILAGYDHAARVLEGAGGYRPHNERGWHSTGTCGSFGAAAASARLLRLDAERFADALGIASTFTGGIWAFLDDGAMTKRFHPGRAAENGLSAALLAAAATRDQAAAWIAGQVAADAIVACDPAMCAALQAAGLPTGRLIVLGASAADPLGSDVIAATAAVRSQFGARLESVYAPLIIASFGSGAGRIDIRAVAPDGAAAYQAALTADLRARITAGRELAGNRRVSVSAAARAALDAGRVDPRLLLTLATLAHGQPLRIVAFGDPSPGASPAVPFRSAEITVAGRGDGTSARLRSLLSFVDAQRPPYLPAHAGIGGGSVLTVEYAAPSPLGLLSGP